MKNKWRRTGLPVLRYPSTDYITFDIYLLKHCKYELYSSNLPDFGDVSFLIYQPVDAHKRNSMQESHFVTLLHIGGKV